MKTLYDIIEAAKDGGRPTPNETYHAMLVLVALLNMATQDIRRMQESKPPFDRIWAEESHRRYREALNADPVAYLGNNVPGNPEYDRFREAGKKLFDKAMKKESDEPN